jgi:hypothetical protein
VSASGERAGMYICRVWLGVSASGVREGQHVSAYVSIRQHASACVC